MLRSSIFTPPPIAEELPAADPFCAEAHATNGGSARTNTGIRRSDYHHRSRDQRYGTRKGRRGGRKEVPFEKDVRCHCLPFQEHIRLGAVSSCALRNCAYAPASLLRPRLRSASVPCSPFPCSCEPPLVRYGRSCGRVTASPWEKFITNARSAGSGARWMQRLLAHHTVCGTAASRQRSGTSGPIADIAQSSSLTAADKRS